MRLFKRILNYYRNPDHARRLATSLLLVPVIIYQLWLVLKRTFWYEASTRPESIVFLLAALFCCGLAFRLFLRGTRKAPFAVRAAELMPAITVAVASIIVQLLYHFSIT